MDNIIKLPDEKPFREYEAEVSLNVHMELDAESTSDMENYIFSMTEMMEKEWGFPITISNFKINKI